LSFRKVIQVFEHKPLKVGQLFVLKNGEKLIIDQKRHITKLVEYHEREFERNNSKEKAEYFTLIKDGVKFKQFVGVIKVGELIIEVLPKIDEIESLDDDKFQWQTFLYSMLKEAIDVDGKITGYAPINYHQDNFIDIYISYFLNHVEYLLRTGLVKKYHKKEGNLNALKGSIHFSKQISKNLVHLEKFFVTYSNYDFDNMFNQILYKALIYVKRINTNPRLTSKIETLLFNFPEVKNIAVSEAFFNKIIYDRKTNDYRNAINLAKFILLKLHPDLQSGQTETLAIMFDMNKLWEKYVFKLLRKEVGDNYNIEEQLLTDFWEPQKGNTMRIKPDIIVREKASKKIVTVLDIKWKNLKTDRPADDDIKQMLAYNLYNLTEIDYFKRSSLVFPSMYKREKVEGSFAIKNHGTCSLLFVSLFKENDQIKPDLKQLINFIKH
jgi:5-methylcytosine-specific restriction enzyme subunit McrC